MTRVRTNGLPPENTPPETTGEPTGSPLPEPDSQTGQQPTARTIEERRLIKFEIAARRLQVGRMYSARVGQQEIAERLKVDQSTISRDITFLKKKWLKDASLEVQAYLAQELAELDEMERRVAECFENKNTYLKDYNPRWMEVRLKIKERKAAILGLNKNIIELRGSKDSPLEVNIQDVRKRRWEVIKDQLRDALGPLGDQPADDQSQAAGPDDETGEPENLSP